MAQSRPIAELPAYSGPGGACPKCRVGGVLTEWHRAGGVLGPRQMAQRESPCKLRTDLQAFGGKGEHLCRLCRNCNYGWVEACADATAADPPTATGTSRLTALPRAEDNQR